ncbi:hypothetical protein [Actinomadura rugatobispora]|uniref:Uncharacterized protein n=1 Tax=Actinomadura rugatobispora TaxID=1994 RepID=A0ABW0ZNA0_9ACTN|nr:hypothetical protein GCM10010200_059600 [Actinomadura rugatobispora]
MSRAARAVMATLVLTALMTCLVMPLTAQPASACHVGVGYRPNIEIDLNKIRSGGSLFGDGEACTTRHSLAGAAVVAVAVLGVMGVLGARVLRKGEIAAGGSQQSAQVLDSYIHATGTSQPGPPLMGGPGAP